MVVLPNRMEQHRANAGVGKNHLDQDRSREYLSLALALGQILSGAVLVEVIYAYPGIGTVLFHAIRENDHFLIQGIVFSVIVALGVATLLLDVLYPWLDPRITYRRA